MLVGAGVEVGRGVAVGRGVDVAMTNRVGAGRTVAVAATVGAVVAVVPAVGETTAVASGSSELHAIATTMAQVSATIATATQERAGSIPRVRRRLRCIKGCGRLGKSLSEDHGRDAHASMTDSNMANQRAETQSLSARSIANHEVHCQ